jgi:hypothetical protein
MSKHMKTNNCPKCGGWWKYQSGFYICIKCGHRMGSQNNPVRVAINCNPIAPVDQYEWETDMPDRPGKLNTQLDFDP